MIIKKNVSLHVLDGTFRYIFSKCSKLYEISHSELTDNELSILLTALQSLVIISDEEMTLIFQSIIAILTFLISAISCACCTKLHQTKKIVKGYRRRYPPQRQQPKEMTKFLKKYNKHFNNKTQIVYNYILLFIL